MNIYILHISDIKLWCWSLAFSSYLHNYCKSFPFDNLIRVIKKLVNWILCFKMEWFLFVGFLLVSPIKKNCASDSAAASPAFSYHGYDLRRKSPASSSNEVFKTPVFIYELVSAVPITPKRARRSAQMVATPVSSGICLKTTFPTSLQFGMGNVECGDTSTFCNIMGGCMFLGGFCIHLLSN